MTDFDRITGADGARSETERRADRVLIQTFGGPRWVTETVAREADAQNRRDALRFYQQARRELGLNRRDY